MKNKSGTFLIIMKLKVFITLSILLLPGISSSATGPYTSTISTMQVSYIGNPYNTVWLTMDVIDSPCSSTNQLNRFTIVNEAQLSTILAALMANKVITVYGTGTCTANIESVSDIRISPQTN